MEGADAVEVDVQETADGEVVLLHDTDLRRVAGVGRSIWDLPYADLQALDVGSWFSPAFQAERIPTLRAFAAASRGRTRLNVELKNNRHGQDLAARVINVLHETGTADHAVISSLDIDLLRQVRHIAPQIKLGLILAAGVGNFRSVDVDFFALSRRLATPAVIRQLHAIGRQVHVWTLNDKSGIAQAMLDGADNIITSDPSVATEMRVWFHGLSEPDRTLLRLGRFLGTSRLHATIPSPSLADEL
jgi:glycerophosphoryl diester phosphodiesterase